MRPNPAPLHTTHIHFKMIIFYNYFITSRLKFDFNTLKLLTKYYILDKEICEKKQ